MHDGPYFYEAESFRGKVTRKQLRALKALGYTGFRPTSKSGAWAAINEMLESGCIAEAEEHVKWFDEFVAPDLNDPRLAELAAEVESLFQVLVNDVDSIDIQVAPQDGQDRA